MNKEDARFFVKKFWDVSGDLGAVGRLADLMHSWRQSDSEVSKICDEFKAAGTVEDVRKICENVRNKFGFEWNPQEALPKVEVPKVDPPKIVPVDGGGEIIVPDKPMEVPDKDVGEIGGHTQTTIIDEKETIIITQTKGGESCSP